MRFLEQRTPMGGSTETEARVTECVAQPTAHTLFITPRADVETLCRLALLRYLEGCDAELARAATVLLESRDHEVEPARGVDPAVCSRLEAVIEGINVVDPACGEGHMLVGALEALDTLLARATEVLGCRTDRRTRRLELIRNNLYGVEVKGDTLLRAQQRLCTVVGEPDPCIARAISAHLIQADALLWRDEFEREPCFQGVRDSGGFQLVLGNPPYVRHEMISDPLLRLPAAEYKGRVFAIVESILDDHGHPALDGGRVRTTLSRRSDLSVLFAVLGLSLLAPGGVLGFVLPNAVRSARYGEVLWQLLGTESFEGRLVENLTRRSFASAAINTALLIAYRRTDPARALPGCQAPASNDPPIDVADETTSAGGSSGPLGLAARDLQSRIERCSTPLSGIGQVKYPIKTGLNCFFYPDASTRARFRIEPEFLIPVVKSPRDIHALAVSGNGLPTVLFHCRHSPDQLRELGATGALDYIEWGEAQTRLVGTDGGRTARLWPSVPSLRGRTRWYTVPLPGPAHVLCPRFIHRRFFFALPTDDVLLDQTFYGLELAPHLLPRRLLVGAFLNSSLGLFDDGDPRPNRFRRRSATVCSTRHVSACHSQSGARRPLRSLPR